MALKLTNPYDKYKMPPDMESIAGVVDTYLRWKNKKDKHSRSYTSWHPSEFGHCLRKMQYCKYEEEGKVERDNVEELTSQQLRLFEKGHNMQSRWTRYFEAIGILRGIWICENICCRMWDDNGNFIGDGNIPSQKPRIYGLDNKIGCFKPDSCICGCKKFKYDEVEVKDAEMNIYGHADLILDFSRFNGEEYKDVIRTFNLKELPKKPIVADMKTIKSTRFDNLLMQKSPDLGYQVQLTIYANILDCEYGVLFYENKDNSELAVFRVDKQTDTWFETIKEQAIKMTQMAKETLLPPPRPFAKNDYDCLHCPFRGKCHSSSVWENPKLNEIRRKFYGSLLK